MQDASYNLRNCSGYLINCKSLKITGVINDGNRDLINHNSVTLITNSIIADHCKILIQIVNISSQSLSMILPLTLPDEMVRRHVVFVKYFDGESVMAVIDSTYPQLELEIA